MSGYLKFYGYRKRLQTFVARNPGNSFAARYDGKRHGIQSVFWLFIQPTFWLAGRCQAYVKHRSTENFSPVFSIWKQARANLCATALIATMPLRLAFLRW